MNDMMKMVMNFDGMDKSIRHIPGPEGVRGRNSDNKLILEKLGWEPTIRLEVGGGSGPGRGRGGGGGGRGSEEVVCFRCRHPLLTIRNMLCPGRVVRLLLQDGLRLTYGWIKGELEKQTQAGKDVSEFSKSMVVGTQAPKELGTLRGADGEEGLKDK